MGKSGDNFVVTTGWVGDVPGIGLVEARDAATPPQTHTTRINQSQKSLVPRLRKPDLTEVIESQKQKQKTHSKITRL